MQKKSSKNQQNVEGKGSQSTTNQQAPQVASTSPDKQEKPKIEVKVTENTAVRVPRVTSEKIMCLVIIILMIPCCIIYTNSDWVPAAVYNSEQFNFQVFCPIYHDFHDGLLKERDQTFSGWVMQHLYPLADKVSIYKQLHGKQQRQIYVVKIMDGANQTNSTNYGMRYCGFARPRTGTCEQDAKLICTNPGPTFETTMNEQIVVIWVNQIKKLEDKHKQYVSKNLSSCYQTYANESQRPRFCVLMSKLPQFKDLQYEDPTIVPPADQYQNFTINNMSTPISPYIHGMVGRPSFNGGPLSWFTSRGQVGVGYSTVEKQNVDIMMSVLRRNLKMNQMLTKRYLITDFNYRVDIYQNRQQPANLMYYDTAMSVSKKNLVSGLSGLYFIRDAEIQKILPNIKYQHQILIHPTVAETHTFPNMLNKSEINRIKPIAVASSEDYVFYRDTVYRFRIINADFLKMYHNLKFMGTNAQKQRVEINFYIIGSDSSLRSTPHGPITSLNTIVPAERYDILIQFDKQLSEVVELVHGDNKQLVTRIYLSEKSTPEGSIPKQLPNVPGFDFKSQDSAIQRRRMRPFSKTSDGHIATNGHLTIFEGRSEDPYLGTFEDWYFINNINVPQSIHLDLVQFQTIDQYSLNQVPNTDFCTFYNVDFFMKYATNCRNEMQVGNRSIKPEQFNKFVGETIQDYHDMCRYIASLDKTEYSFCFQKFANEEDNEGPNHLSGLDVDEVCKKNDKSAACTFIYRPEDQKKDYYKYRGQQIKIPQYRKGFKQIQLVPKMAYSRIRIRWTRNDFPQTQTAQNERQRQLFFLASEEQLSEYPGYTYRSTQVQGEECHMMRPIMVKPDPKGKSKTWRQIYAKLNVKQFEQRRNKIYTSWHDDDEF